MKIPVFRNTATNYLATGVRLLQGVLISRWIIGYLGMSSYGLWALLWSFFVYALLLDFGCGAAAQKYTSGGLYNRDHDRYSRLMSTIFSFHCAMALLIAGTTFGMSFCLDWLLRIHDDPAKLDYARRCFLLFGCGAALLFPTGIFPEILVGLQRIYLRNYIIVAMKVLELAATLVALSMGGELLVIITVTLSSSLLTNLVMVIAALRLLPELKLRFGCDRESLREVAGFSGFVFLGILGRMIISRSSRLLISIFCGVYEVGLFQLAGKAGDLCNQAVNQYQENVSPISGALHRRGKFRMLGRIVLGSMRWNSFSAFGVMLVAFVLIDPMLLALFKVDTSDYPSLAMLSRLFIVSMFVTVALRNVPHRFFLMSDRHKLATAIVFSEAMLNLGLNILLLWRGFGAAAVVINSLFIKIVISAVVIVPYLARTLRISPWSFLWQTVVAPFCAGVPAFLYLVWLRGFTSLGAWPMLFAGGFGTLILYFGLLVCFVPRRRIMKYVRKMLRTPRHQSRA